jgi:hypothetical protein
MRETLVPLVVIALVSGAGWYYREPLRQEFEKLSSSQSVPEAAAPAESAPRQDTVYRWVDENGGVHYEQRHSVGSEAVVIDQRRIQSLSQYEKAAKVDANGNPVVEADGSKAHEDAEAKRRGMSAVERLPQAQAAPL